MEENDEDWTGKKKMEETVKGKKRIWKEEGSYEETFSRWWDLKKSFKMFSDILSSYICKIKIMFLSGTDKDFIKYETVHILFEELFLNYLPAIIY